MKNISQVSSTRQESVQTHIEQPPVEGEMFSAEKYTEIANLPSRSGLITKFAFTLNQPLTKLAGTLSGAISQLLIALTNIKENKS